MAWTFPKGFTPEDGAIGTLTAVWDAGGPDEFVFSYSVNIDEQKDRDNFKAVANKYLGARLQELEIERKEKPGDFDILLATLATEMNKG